MSAAPESLGVRRIARLSRRALDASLTGAIAEFGEDALVDLRADGYGHGSHEVERHALAHGVTRLRRDGETAPTVTSDDGMLAYGFAPHQLPVLSLEAEIVAVKSVPAGTAVSYGYQYRTAGPSTLALVGLGYADGVPRLASNRAPVRVETHRGIVAGRIAMDQLVVDLGSIDPAEVRVGGTAVLWDDEATLAAWCEATERSAAALTAGLGRRIQRVWVDA